MPAIGRKPKNQAPTKCHTVQLDPQTQSNLSYHASVNIQAGEVIIEEDALFDMPIPAGQTVDQFFTGEENGTTHLIKDFLHERLKLPQLRAFRALYPARTGLGFDDAVCRLDTECLRSNAFNRTQTKKNKHGVEQHQIYLTVYDCVSRINHSCTPNAIYYLWGKKGRVQVVKELRQGDEITITYNKSESYRRRNTRRAHYQRFYGFTCICPACPSDPLPTDTIEEAEIKRNEIRIRDANRLQMHRLRQQFRDNCPADSTIKPQDAIAQMIVDGKHPY